MARMSRGSRRATLIRTAARIEASGKRIVFKRVVWVAHSLGTVVSYNVLSDLFHRAAILEHSGTRTQKAGVRRFRRALRRFVTLGSPLDKVAFLFGKHVLRPWPEVARPNLLEGGERQNAEDDSQDGEWWVNYYHVLDPVSGGLGDPLICHNTPPLNLHSSCLLFGFIPGVAHILYWVDTSRTLRFILGRTYGRRYLRDKIVKPIGPVQRWLLAAFTYIFLLALLYGAAWFAIAWAPELLREAVKSLPSLLGL